MIAQFEGEQTRQLKLVWAKVAEALYLNRREKLRLNLENLDLKQQIQEFKDAAKRGGTNTQKKRYQPWVWPQDAAESGSSTPDNVDTGDNHTDPNEPAPCVADRDDCEYCDCPQCAQDTLAAQEAYEQRTALHEGWLEKDAAQSLEELGRRTPPPCIADRVGRNHCDCQVCEQDRPEYKEPPFCIAKRVGRDYCDCPLCEQAAIESSDDHAQTTALHEARLDFHETQSLEELSRRIKQESNTDDEGAHTAIPVVDLTAAGTDAFVFGSTDTREINTRSRSIGAKKKKIKKKKTKVLATDAGTAASSNPTSSN